MITGSPSPNLATERDCKGGYGAKILHASRILGHFTPKVEDDRVLGKLATSAGYSDYYVTKSVRFTEVEVEKEGNAKVYVSDLQKIKELQKQWNLPTQREVVRRLLKEVEHEQSLERQLVEAQNKIAHLQETLSSYERQLDQLQAEKQQLQTATQQLKQEIEVMDQQQVAKTPEVMEAAENVSDNRIDKLEAQMAQMMSMMQRMVSSGNVSTKSQAEESTPAPVVVRKQLATKQEIDWESVPNEQLKGMKVAGAVEEKIYRAYCAIANYNDNAPSNDDRWYIGSTTLSQVSGCNRTATGAWVEVHEITVKDHNSKYGLGQYHNKRHKGVEITDFIGLWEKNCSSSKVLSADNKSKKITNLPVSATTLDIIDYLGSHPEESIQIKSDGKKLTYERVDDEKEHMKAVRIVETGEEIPV